MEPEEPRARATKELCLTNIAVKMHHICTVNRNKTHAERQS